MKQLLFAILILLPLTLVRLFLYSFFLAIWIIGWVIVYWTYQVNIGWGFALTIAWLLISSSIWKIGKS